MAEIEVQRTTEHDQGFTFLVSVSEEGSRTEHHVTLGQDDYTKWSSTGEQPEAFVKRCFEFLLAHEPKESILSRFDVRDINRYFPEFDSEIRSPR